MIHCYLLRIELTDDKGQVNTIRLTNAGMDVIFDGYEYQATGDNLAIGNCETTYDISSQGVTITLSGVNPQYQKYINDNGTFLKAPVDIWTAEVQEETNIVRAATYYHRGFMDTPSTKVDGEAITLEAETESAFGNLDRKPNLCGANYANHSSLHKGDLFFSRTAITDSTKETWKKD